MRDCERRLTDEDLRKVMENDGDVYCLFSEAMLIGYGVYSARIIERDGEQILQYSCGDSCD